MMNTELYDLTNPQKSIWLTEQFYRRTSIANVSGTFSLDVKLDFNLLEKSINKFLENNDGLRIQIKLDNGIPKQYIVDYNFIKIKLIDVKDRPSLDKIVDSMIDEPIDLVDSPLYKFVMFRYPNGHGGFFAIANHIVSDAWSTSLLVSRITNIYLNFVNNDNIEVDSSSYLDYINSEQEYVNSNKYLLDKKYWEDKYSSMPDTASFSQTSKSNLQNSRAKRIRFLIPKDESCKIFSFCNENKISPFTFFLLIYSIYLSRICNLDTVNVGTPILNRTNAREKKCIGMFVNTLPFQIKLDKASSFLDAAKLLAVDELTVLRHQKYPYIELLQHLRKTFNTDNGLYDFVLSYQNAKNTIDSSKVAYESDWNFNHNISESLNVHISDMDNTNSLKIFYDYQISKFTEAEINSLHSRILYLIDQVLQSPNTYISDYEIVTDNEKNNILYNFNSTNANYPKDKTVTDIFEDQVLKTPHNIAVKINNEEITYEDLNNLANRLAYTLKKYNISANVPVAIRLNKSINMIVAIIAVIKSGGCYLPIDLSYPKERIDFMLKDSNCKLLITNSLHVSDFKLDPDIQIINVDDSDSFSDNVSNLPKENLPSDNIYIIYTSGSTGTPKGVVLSHLNVVRLLKNDKFLFDFNDNDVWTMFHSIAFDFSVWEMYGALLYGGKLILVPENVSKDPFLFRTLLKNEGVTILNQTPTFFYNLMDVELLQKESDLKVRYIIFGGEDLKPRLIKAWKDKYPFTKLINMYGITETTVHVTFRELTSEDLLSTDPIIGKPIPTLKVYIMDENQKLMPYGVEGEICVAGLGICKGYLNRPELNKLKFVNNPYIEGELLYRSADSGYLDYDNNLHYIGRIDNQVKVRGFRVELGEIESKLLKHPNIAKCVVCPHRDDKDNFLVAYIVTKKDISSYELKDYIRRLVPTYMVPNHFVMLKELPLTSNGKVDRKKLVSIPIKMQRETEYVAPSNDFEKTMVTVIESSLCISNVGINDDIIKLGADSLSLMKITISLLGKGISLNLQNFYEYRTISEIERNFNLEHTSIVNTINKVYNYFDESFSNEKIILKNILLTGATGFLGIHILKDLLCNTSATVYCLIRDKNGVDGKQRLCEKLHKYFNSELDNFVDNRLQVIRGDITEKDLGLSSMEYVHYSNLIDNVIHAAAIVSHYGDPSTFNKINVLGTKNVIEFCKRNNISLNYISTLSISGNLLNDSKVEETFNEHSIYIGQNVSSNVYIQSKLDAEIAIHKASSEGLKSTVYRLGNITARLDDYMFQDNYKDNAFLNRIISLAKLKMVPEYLLNVHFDLSPVDLCSNFIVNLLQYSDSYGKIFHINNTNLITFSQMVDCLNSFGYNIKVVNDNNFKVQLSKIAKNKDDLLLGIINDITNEHILYSNFVNVDSTYTSSILEKNNMFWNVAQKQYLYNFIKKFL